MYNNNDFFNDIHFDKRYITPPSSPVALNQPENYQRLKRDISAEEYSIKNRLNNFLMSNFEINPDYVAQNRNEEEADLPKAKLFKVKAANFLKMLKPKFRKAKNTMKNKFDELFGKTISINDIDDDVHNMNKRRVEPELFRAEHFMHKRNVEQGHFTAEDFEGNRERVRKHCPNRCVYPCPLCGGGTVMAPPPLQPIQPQYFEFVNGEASAFSPIVGRAAVPAAPSPRYIFDRFGHRYLENEGSLKLLAPSRSDDGPVIGSSYDGGYRPVNFNQLENILDHNSEFIDETNQGDPEHLIQDPIQLVMDTMSFISDIATRRGADRHQPSYERSMTEPNKPQTEAVLITISGPADLRAEPNVPPTNFVDRSGMPYAQNRNVVDTFRNDDDVRRFLFGSNVPQRQTSEMSMLPEYMRHNI